MKEDLREVKASIRVDGAEVFPHYISINHEVNAIPMIEMKYFETDELMKKSASDMQINTNSFSLVNFRDTLKVMSEQVYNKEQHASVYVELETSRIDGSSQSKLTFNGILSAPNYSVNTGRMERTAQIHHRDIIMESYDPSIYDVMLTDSHGKITPNINEKPNEKSLVEKIIGVMDPGMIDDPEQLIANQSFDLNKTYYARHSVNLEIYRNYIRPFLAWNVQGTSIFKNIGDVPFINAKEFNQLIADSVYTSSSFLTSIFSQLCPLFDLQYVAQLSSNPSLLQETQYMGNIDGSDLYIKVETPVMSLDCRASGKANPFPIGSVVVTGERVVQWGNITGIGETQLRSATAKCRYPDQDKNFPKFARQFNTTSPVWLKMFGYTPSNITERDDVTDGNNDPKAHPDIKEAEHNELRDTIDKYEDYLKYYAKKTYNNVLLEGSVASISIPLNLSIQPGKCYEIAPINKDDEVLESIIKGYVVGVQHNISLDSSNPSAITSIYMTHAHVPTFKPILIQYGRVTL